MNRISQIFFFILLSSYSFSQSLQGIVIDKYNQRAIPSATLIYGKAHASTDMMGKFTLPGSQKDSLHIISRGYVSQHIAIQDTGKLVILLDPSVTARNYIQVVSLEKQGSALSIAGSIETLTAADLGRTNGIRVEDAINTLPGVRLEKRADNGALRMVIRGYGNQSNTQGSGYKAYYNEIPLTEADGTTLLDDVDAGTLGRVEVTKGPVGGTYGTGIGGLVLLYSEKAPPGISVRQSAVMGSYGQMRTNTSLGIGSRESNIQINYARQLSDGYRKHTVSKNDFVTLTGDFYSTEKKTISVFISYTKHFAQLAGQLSRKQLESVPDTAELTLLQNDANIDIESYRAGITQQYKWSDRFSNKTTLFFVGQSIDQSGNAILNKMNKSRFGARTSFDWSQKIGEENALFSFGAEVNKSINYQKSYNYVTGVLGTVRSDMEVKPTMYHAFAQVNLLLKEGTTITAGGSINYLEYNIVDERAAVSGYINTSGYKRFKPLFTPDFSMTHFLNSRKTISVYTAYHVGYSPPATTQVVITQTGLVNNSLDPEIAESFEIGSKGSLFNSKLNYRLALFNMDVKDKFITQNFAAASGVPAYAITTNAGTVNGKGVEFSLEYVYAPSTGAITLLKPFFSWTYSDFSNVDLQSDNNNNTATKHYNGLAVSGIAKDMVSAGVDIETAAGFYLYLTDLYTGKMPIVLDNSEYADAYSLLNGKIGWRKVIPSKRSSDKWTIDIFAGADNITNQLYSPMLSINQAYVGATPTVAGTSQALFFNPAPPKATWYAGCSLRISL